MTVIMFDHRELGQNFKLGSSVRRLHDGKFQVRISWPSPNTGCLDIFISEAGLRDLLRTVEAQFGQAIDDEAERVSDSHLYGRKDTGE